MKYMHSEWQRRLAHWQHTLQMDFYFPLGSIDVESFFTTEHLTPEEAQSRHFEPMSAGTTWGIHMNTAGCTAKSSFRLMLPGSESSWT